MMFPCRRTNEVRGFDCGQDNCDSHRSVLRFLSVSLSQCEGAGATSEERSAEHRSSQKLKLVQANATKFQASLSQITRPSLMKYDHDVVLTNLSLC